MEYNYKKYYNITDFNLLVIENQNRVFRIVFSFLRNREDAEDVAQEVFVDIYNKMYSFRGKSQITTWMYRIAVNKSLDFMRTKKRKKRFVPKNQRLEIEDVDLGNEPSETSNPGLITEANERKAILKQAVDSITEKQRAAIILNKYEGFSYQEISEIMDTTLSAVESLIHKGMKNLRKKLSTYYEDKI